MSIKEKLFEEKPELDVINGLDMNIDHFIQTLLQPIYQHFPFFGINFIGIPLANFIAATLILLLFLYLRKFFTSIIMDRLQNLTKHTVTYHDDRIISALKAPVSFGFIIIGLHLFFILIFKETHFIKNILNSLILYDIFWAILAILEALRGFIYSSIGKFIKDLTKEVSNFIITILKIIIVSIGLGAILQVWGINVTALVASLGIGGLAFALAAKDTAANLFGSFALLADKSIRIGEWIKVDGVEGTVEDIGMRTTKVRSFGKSLITVPNQIIANNPIENFSRRGIRRIKMTIGVTYGTNSTQLKNIVNEITTMLQTHKGIANKETLMVNFESFGDSSLNIFIYAFTATSNWGKYMTIKQEVHFNIMKIVEKNGSSFAFPSTSIYLENQDTPIENIKKGNK